MKESITILIQSLFESKSVIERVLLLRTSLEALEGIMDIVNKNFKTADDNLIRMHTQARARLSIEYIKQTYLTKPENQNQNP